MDTEKQKMLRGEMYNAADSELVAERKKARLLLMQLNNPGDNEPGSRQQFLRELIPGQGAALWIEPPFHCDYGSNIFTGDNVYFNFNCIILDVMKVSIGNNVLFGPAVQIYTALHPMSSRERSSGVEYAKPVSIGSDTWVGGAVVVCPGVNIGKRCVIGAGSVVTRDIPDDTFAAGNPCRPVKNLKNV